MIIKMQVKEYMCNNVCCAKPETKVSDIAKLMNDKHVGCIPICDNQNKVVGIVTDRDIILRSIACDKDAKQTKVSDIMSCNVCTCGPEDQVCDAENKMAQNQIRRIPVVENNKVVGILTMGDLANFNRELGKEEVCTTIENICDCKGQTKNAE